MSERAGDERLLWDYHFPTGGELRVIRKNLGMTAEGVADELGYSPATIRSWEMEKTQPKLHDLRELVAYYKVLSDKQSD